MRFFNTPLYNEKERERERERERQNSGTYLLSTHPSAPSLPSHQQLHNPLCQNERIQIKIEKFEQENRRFEVLEKLFCVLQKNVM